MNYLLLLIFFAWSAFPTRAAIISVSMNVSTFVDADQYVDENGIPLPEPIHYSDQCANSSSGGAVSCSDSVGLGLTSEGSSQLGALSGEIEIAASSSDNPLIEGEASAHGSYSASLSSRYLFLGAAGTHRVSAFQVFDQTSLESSPACNLTINGFTASCFDPGATFLVTFGKPVTLDLKMSGSTNAVGGNGDQNGVSYDFSRFTVEDLDPTKITVVEVPELSSLIFASVGMTVVAFAKSKKTKLSR